MSVRLPWHQPTYMRRSLPRTLRVLGAATVLAAGGVTISGTAANASTYLGGVDMQRACNEQYPGWGLKASVRDRYNAFSWRCVAPFNTSMYGIDVNRACVRQYGAGASSGLRSTGDPYSWYCKR